MDSLSIFEHGMESNGLACPGPLIGDGRLHRFQGPHDKPRCEDSWYVFYDDESPVLTYGSWETGAKYSCSAKDPRNLSSSERQRHVERIAKARKAADEERKALAETAARKAQEIWAHSIPIPESFPYLVRKQIRSHGARLHEGNLIIPAYDGLGVVRTIQRTKHDGGKWFLPGGAKRGNYFPIGDLTGSIIYLVEGFATGATVHEATGCLVIVAFDAGNLLPVAQRIREKYPDSHIVFAADNNCWKPKIGNPGLEKAREAAEAVGGSVVFPTFVNLPDDAKPTDYNDLFILEGLEAVRAQLIPVANDEHHLSPEPTVHLECDQHGDGLMVSDWQDIIPLDDGTLPELPTDILPDWLETMARSVALFTETPPELAAMLGLSALATACQRYIEIEAINGYMEPLNIFTATAMESGNRKSSVHGAMTYPIIECQERLAKIAASKNKAVVSERKTQEARIKHLRNQAAKARGKGMRI